MYEEENTESNFNDEEKYENMNIFKKGNKTYYTRKSEALESRRKGDRIYYDADLKAYYIVRPKKRDFWGF
jgi:hypothetical protein